MSVTEAANNQANSAGAEDRPRRWMADALAAILMLAPILMFVDFSRLAMDVQTSAGAAGYAMRWFFIAAVLALVVALVVLRRHHQRGWLTVGVWGLLLFAIYTVLLLVMIGPAIGAIFAHLTTCPPGATMCM